MSRFQSRQMGQMGRSFSQGQRGGRYQGQGRTNYQPNDRVTSVEERGEENRFGSWDGDVESIPGAMSPLTGTPDMRDNVNREAFLGETSEDRAYQRSINLTRGVSERYGVDPQEIGDRVREIGDSGFQGRRRYGRPQQGQRGRFQGQQGQQGQQGRFQGQRGNFQGRLGGQRGRSRQGQDLGQVLGEFQEVHSRELQGLNDLNYILELANQNRFSEADWNQLQDICQEAERLSQQEGQLIGALGEESGPNNAIQELEEVNGYEQDCLRQLAQVCQEGGELDWQQIERIYDELDAIGQKETQIMGEIEDSLRGSNQGRGNQGYQGRGNQGRGNQGYQGRGNQGRPFSGRSSSQGRPTNDDGSPDLRDSENRDRLTMQRYGKPGSARYT